MRAGVSGGSLTYKKKGDENRVGTYAGLSYGQEAELACISFQGGSALER